MELGYDILVFMVKACKALHHFTGGIAKEGRLNIVPLTWQAVQPVQLPQPGEYFIFLIKIRGEINKYDNGLS